MVVPSPPLRSSTTLARPPKFGVLRNDVSYQTRGVPSSVLPLYSSFASGNATAILLVGYMRILWRFFFHEMFRCNMLCGVIVAVQLVIAIFPWAVSSFDRVGGCSGCNLCLTVTSNSFDVLSRRWCRIPGRKCEDMMAPRSTMVLTFGSSWLASYLWWVRGHGA